MIFRSPHRLGAYDMSASEAVALENIVGVAISLPRQERMDFLLRVCGTDRQLYEAAMRRLTDKFPDWYDSGDEPDSPQPTGSRVSTGSILGPYRVLRSLGHGGMGEVFLAERADMQFEQRVAIKLVKRDLISKEVQARLRLERQILASLEHPNIARLLDGGTTTDGIPYIVMEYVDGKPIDTYCDELQLSIAQRLQLFRSVCSAVHSAHQNLIVHRDLKPSNILVTASGVPKLLDFGIAKLLDTRSLNQTVAVTQADARMMTPDHASPEQLRGDLITTASDTYVLGVLLYELLTGFKPFVLKGKSLAELEATICEQPPLHPSQVFTAAGTRSVEQLQEVARQRSSSIGRLRRDLQGDLGNIVLMALRKEPDRRYSSVLQFSEDVERYLQGMPVQARIDTWTYRTSKFIKRHSLVVALSLIFIATLIGFSAYALAQRNLADAERQGAQTIATFLIRVFETSDPAEALGKELSAGQILDMIDKQIDVELADQPRQLAVFLGKIGSTYVKRGQLEKAKPRLERALAMMAKLSIESTDTVDAILDLAAAHINLGELEPATALVNRGIILSTKLEGRGSRGVARGLCALGLIGFEGGQLDQAKVHLEQCLSLYRSLPNVPAAELAIPLENLARIFGRRNNYVEQARLLRELLALNQGLDRRHPAYLQAQQSLANALQGAGDLAAAEIAYREVLELVAQVHSKQGSEYATTLTNLGRLLQRKQDFAAADAAYQQALSIFVHLEQAQQSNNERSGWVVSRMADLAADQDKLDKAEELYKRSLKLHEQTKDKGYEGAVRIGLSKLQLQTRRGAEAETTIAPALKIWRGTNRSRYGLAQAIMGRALYLKGDPLRAEALLQQGYENFLDGGDRNSPDAQQIDSWLAEARATAPGNATN
jgi:eukaryotic-like serine/threonine-protein kinase